MILQLKTGRLDPSYFRGKFGVEIAQEFREGFDSLVAEGLGQHGVVGEVGVGAHSQHRLHVLVVCR